MRSAPCHNVCDYSQYVTLTHDASSNFSQFSDVMMTKANLMHLISRLMQMRVLALKVGQFLLGDKQPRMVSRKLII